MRKAARGVGLRLRKAWEVWLRVKEPRSSVWLAILVLLGQDRAISGAGQPDQVSFIDAPVVSVPLPPANSTVTKRRSCAASLPFSAICKSAVVCRC